MNVTHIGQLNATPSPSPVMRNDVEVYVQVVVLVIICIGSVFGNVFVIGIVIFHHKLHKPTYYFISSLASADFLVGAIYIPFYIMASLAQNWYISLTWCKWHATFISVSINASLVTLSLVSVDRYLAITDPLRYQTILTTIRSVVLLLLGWVHSIFWAFAPQFGWGEVVYQPKTSTCRPNWGAKGLANRVYTLGLALLPFGAPVICMIYCYCRIFFVARYHVREIKKNSVNTPGSNTIGQRAMETKAMKTLLIVLGAFVVSWLPYTVLSMAKMISKGSLEFSSSILNAVLTITLLNGCVNPVIYAIRDKRFCKGMKRMLCPLARKDSQDFNSYLSSRRDTTKETKAENFEMGNINFAQES